MPSVAYSRFAAEVLALYSPPFRRAGTRTKMAQALAEFGSSKGLRRTSDITPVLISQWILAHQDRKPITNHSVMRSFRSACAYAKKMGYIKTSPFEYRPPSDWIPVEPDDSPDPVDKHHSAEEIARVLQLVDRDAAGGSWDAGRLQALIYVYAYTGMRKREALGLRKQDVDLERRVITIRSHSRRRLKTKASGAPIAIADDLAEVLARWLPRTGCEWVFPQKRLTGPWNSGTPGSKPLDRVKDAGMRAGVPGLTIASFRHTIGTLAEGWGIGELELMRWLRHTKTSTQTWYRKHADRDTLQATAKKISFKGTGS